MQSLVSGLNSELLLLELIWLLLIQN
jgi:hypothetical protein